MLSQKNFLVDPTTEENYKALKYLTNTLYQVSGINEINAKTIIYYCMATYHVKDYDIFPALSINGVSSSGKSSTLKFISKLCSEPVWISGHDSISGPYLRRKLQESKEKTLIMEEGDLYNDRKQLQSWIINRTDRQASNIGTMEQVILGNNIGYKESEQSVFGALIFSDRHPVLTNIATNTRVISIPTKYAPGQYIKVPDNLCDLFLPTNNVWYAPDTIPNSNRFYDVWKPLIEIASYLEDDNWLYYIAETIKNNIAQLSREHQAEENQTVFGGMMAAFSNSNTAMFIISNSLKINDITLALRNEVADHMYTNQYVRKVLENMGFMVKRKGGHSVLTTTPAEVKMIANKINYEDDILGQIP